MSKKWFNFVYMMRKKADDFVDSHSIENEKVHLIYFVADIYFHCSNISLYSIEDRLELAFGRRTLHDICHYHVIEARPRNGLNRYSESTSRVTWSYTSFDSITTLFKFKFIRFRM